MYRISRQLLSINRRFFLLYLFLVLPLFSRAQQTYALSEVLQYLENKFQCSFSYADRTVAGIEASVPQECTTLRECLDVLQQKTRLRFTLLTNRSVVVSKALDAYCLRFADKQTNAKITNATIQVQDSTYVSDQEGKIRFIPHTLATTIKVSVLGFVPKVIRPDTVRTCQDVFLIPTVQKLAPTIVNQYSIQGIDLEDDTSLRVDYSDFGVLPGLLQPDVLQTVQAIPGVQSVNENVTDINIRGGSNDQNLILWNGIKMYQSGHFFGLISAFNPYITQSATLIKNGTGVRYADGVSGVIDIRSRDSLVSSSVYGIGASMVQSDVYGMVRIHPKISLQLGGRISTNRWLKTPTYDQFFEKSFQNSEIQNGEQTSDDQFNFYDVSGRLLVDLSDKDKLRINGIQIRNRLRFLENQDTNSEILSRESETQQQTLAGSFRYKRTWNPQFQSSISAYGSRYVLDATNADISNAQRLLQKNEVLENGIQADLAYQFAPAVKATIGYQFNETGIRNVQDVTNPNFRRSVKEVIRSHAAYANWDWRLFEKTRLHGGIRSTYYSKFDELRVEPRLSVSQTLGNRWTLQLAGGYKNQVTSQSIDVQTDFLGVENRRWILSDGRDVPIIESRQGSVNLIYKRKGWLLSTEGYLKRVEGITTQSQGFEDQLQFIRTSGEYDVYGIDVLTRKAWKNWNVWASYSYAENEYTFSTLEPPQFPNQVDIRHFASGAISYATPQLQIATGLSYRTGSPFTNLATDEIGPEGTIRYASPNTSRNSEFWRWDASITYLFLDKKSYRVRAGLSFFNIWNRDNQLDTAFTVSNGEIIRLDQKGLRFTPNATLRFEFF